MNVNQRWTELRRAIQSSARKYVGYEGKRRPKKPWITEEMINKMNERRSGKMKVMTKERNGTEN